MESVQEQVAKRAYELFEARGGQDGYHIEDWLQAEKEVSSAIAAAAKPATKKTPKPVAEPKKAAVKKPAVKKAVKKVTAPKNVGAKK